MTFSTVIFMDNRGQYALFPNAQTALQQTGSLFVGRNIFVGKAQLAAGFGNQCEQKEYASHVETQGSWAGNLETPNATRSK
jgi:hypothetical protein